MDRHGIQRQPLGILLYNSRTFWFETDFSLDLDYGSMFQILEVEVMTSGFNMGTEDSNSDPYVHVTSQTLLLREPCIFLLLIHIQRHLKQLKQAVFSLFN